MRRLAITAAMTVMCAAGCASARQESKKDQNSAQAQPAPVQAQQKVSSGEKGGAGATFVDQEHGFQIEKPDRSWVFKPVEDVNNGSIAVPVVVSNQTKQAQVVVQVAPAVATPSQFAERLSAGLQSRAGFITSDVQPIPVADGAVGFDFAVADQVNGRVAVMDGGHGQVYVLLATWPKDSPDGVEKDVNSIMGSVKPAPHVD